MATTRVQDFYKATITRNWTATTGDFNVSVAPTITAGIIVISPNSTTQREIVRYTATGTNQYGPFVTISDVADRGLSGTTAQSHIIGEQVRMNVTAVHWDELLADAVAPTVDIGTTTTLEPGSDATATNSGTTIDAILDFGIPAGSTIYSGTSIPDNSVGRNGDWAFDTSVNCYVWYKSGGTWALVNSLKGATGDGNGIASITKTGTVGLVDTYTITYDDATTSTFNITNGAKGDTGDAGVSVVSIIKTDTVGLVDTYTITYSNSTTSTFTVTNGQDGTNGLDGIDGIDGTDGISFTPKGAYNALTEYIANDVVSYLGSTWIALQTTTGNTPEEGAYWTLNASKGTDGEGSGDMLASVYDPTNVAGDAFDMDNMAQGTTNKFLSSAELTVVQNTSGTNTGDQEATDFDIKDLTDSTSLMSTWSGKQDSLGFTPENVANKVTSFQATPDDSHYISEKLAKDSLDAKMTNPMTTQGDIIYGGASGLPTRLAKGTAGQVLKMNNAETAPEWGTGSSSAPYMFCPYAASPSITQADEEFNVIYSAAQQVVLTAITNNNLIKIYSYASIWPSANGIYGIVIIGGYIYFLLSYSTPDPDQFKLFRMSLTDTAYTSVTEITFSGATTLIDSNNSTMMSSDGTNLYFTYNAGNSSNRYILAKFSLSGTTATYVSSITLSDSPTSFNNYSVDSSGNIYTVENRVVKKYNSSGTLQITSEQPIGDANSLLNFKGTMYWYSPYKGCYYKLMG